MQYGSTFFSDESEHAVIDRSRRDVERAKCVVIGNLAVDEVPVHLELLYQDLRQLAASLVFLLVQHSNGALEHVGMYDPLLDQDVAKFFFCAACLHWMLAIRYGYDNEASILLLHGLDIQ